MNKIINTLIIVLFFFLNLPLRANNTMSVVDQSAYTGSVIEVEINLENADNVAAFQLDVVLPEGFVYQEDGASMEPDRIDGHVIGANLIAENVLRIVSYANPTAHYTGNDGVIARFNLETPVTPNDYVFNIDNLVLSDSDGENVASTSQNGTITLNDPPEPENILIIHDVEATVGEIIDVYVEIENADPFVAFQFDILLPGGFVYEEESVVLTGREVDHVIQASMINENTLRVLSYSNTNAEFVGNDGNVAALELQTPINAGTHQLEFDENEAVITHISFENIITGITNGIVTLQKATPEITQWPEASPIKYGEKLTVSTLTGGEADVDGEFTFDDHDVEPEAGTYNADITFIPNDTDNYNTVSGQVSVSVEPKELMVINAVVQDKVYDGNTAAVIEGAEPDGVLEGDFVELENHTVGNFEQATVGENITVLTNMLINGDDAGNYVLTQPELYADIIHASLTVTANDIVKQYGVEFEFDGTEFVVNPEPFGSDEVTSVTLVSDGEPADAEAGEHIIYISDAVGVGLSNYDIIYENGIMDVSDRIILNIDGLIASDKDYDGTRDAVIENWGTLEDVDPEYPDVVLDNSSAAAEFSQSDVDENITVTVTGLELNGEDADVYNIGYQTTTASIFEIPLSVTANDAEKVYGDDDPFFTVSYEGFVAGQDHNYLDGVLVFEREEGEDTGSYTITPSGLTSNNYEITFETGALTITQRPVEITADSKTKVYSENDPDLTFQITEGELVFDDEFAGELVREEGEDVGEYEILQGTVELNDNYNLNYISDNLVITAKTLVITPDEDQYKVFEEPDTEITYTFDEEDLVGDDEITGELSREAGEDVGVYDITAGTLTAGNNYQLEIVQEVFTIYAQLTVEVNDSDAGSAIIVDGIDLYLTGEEATVEATANEGYNFVEWTVNGSFESDSPVFDYEMPGHNVTIKANFAEDVETFALTLTAVPEEAATFTGEGEYPEGDIVNITTGVNEGYAFMYWLDDEQVVSYEKDFAYEMPAEDTQLIAHFSEESNDFENNIVIVGDVTAEPGEIITIEVDVENEDPFTAFQMDFQLPEGFVLVENSPELSERAGNHSIASNVLEGNVFRVLAYSMTNEDFSGNQGMLLSFELETPGEEGAWELLAENVSLTNINSQNIFTGSYPGNIVLEIPAETFTVTFVIEDEDGDQINNAVVTFNNIENTEGDYVFENVEPGTYSYIVSADGYKEADGRIEVMDDDVFETIALEVDDTSIEIYEGFELMVYPNPVRNKLTVESNKNMEQVRIIDISGQVILDKTIGGLHTEIFVDNLQTGIYFLQVQTEEGVRTHKIQVY